MMHEGQKALLSATLWLVAFVAVGMALPTHVTLTTSRGMINAEPTSVLELIEMEESMFYRLDIDAAGIDLIAKAEDGIANLPSFDCVTAVGRPATLIAPDLAVGCAHYTYGVGDTITFGGESAIVVGVVFHPDWDCLKPSTHDVSFIRLDRELSVQPALVAPLNWQAWMGLRPGVAYIASLEIPVVAVRGGSPIVGTLEWTIQTAMGFAPGDSGSPVGFVIDGRYVLIGVVVSSSGTFNPIEPVLEIDRQFSDRFLTMPYTTSTEPPVTNEYDRIPIQWINTGVPHPLQVDGQTIY